MSFLSEFIAEFWSTLAEMAPYLLFGFLVAGILSVFISARVVERHLGRGGMGSVIKAALLGVPLPLCSCGVIPVSMSLYKHGAGKSSTISFLLSTPQTGVDSILVTYSLLGPLFAIVRPITALLTGIIGGELVHLAEGKSDQTVNGASSGCQDECCSSEEKKKPVLVRILRHGFFTLPRGIGGALLIGIIAAGLISALVPDDFFSTSLTAGGGIVAMLLMMVVGVPFYVCATASVPIAAGLLAKGLSPGAVLVFLMTGPATNAASFSTIWSTLGLKTTLIYLLTVIGSSLGFGMLLNLFVQHWTQVDMTHVHGQMLPAWVGHLSAVILLVVLFYSRLAPRLGGSKSQPPAAD